MYPEEQGFGPFTCGAQSEHLFTWNEGYISKGGKWEDQFTSNLGTRWTDPVTARRVSKKVKGNRKGSKGNQQGEEKSKGIAPCI
jgi:hypothetical protein